MDLRTYLLSLGKPGKAALATACNTSPAYLEQIAGGHRACREALAMAIDRASGGAVTVEELRPDLIAHWQYLRGTAKRVGSEAG